MSPETIISAASWVALLLTCAAFFITIWRVITGPTLPDRIVALDMLVAIAIGFVAVEAIKTGYTLYVDIAIALGLVGFLATVAFARFLMAQGMPADEAGTAAPAARPGGAARHKKTRRR
ncbi:cation:proton antiporter [Rhizobium sp. TRM95111]|uniref:cation:proton antiporter n=1 Tax=Rhizobium alarense TaxID=2846851 RepID=UPI001F0B8825|nr:cation:proton antiporter [Rhizobium alarense]MCF3638608.1 cation:proton antiporter [Rhizobium alarense]